MLGVTPLLVGRVLMYGGGCFVALSFPLMHGTVVLVAHGGVVNGTPARLDGAFPGELGAMLGCLGPLLGGERVLLMAVHGAKFPTASYLPARGAGNSRRARVGRRRAHSPRRPRCVTKLNPLWDGVRKGLPARAPQANARPP